MPSFYYAHQRITIRLSSLYRKTAMPPLPVIEWRFKTIPLFMVILTALLGMAFTVFCWFAACFFPIGGWLWGISGTAGSIAAVGTCFHLFRLWQHTRDGHEYLRLDDHGLHYCIYPHGEHSLSYDALHYVSTSSGGHTRNKLRLEYRTPGHRSALPQVQTLNLWRLRCHRFRGILAASTEVRNEIKKRCPNHVVYD